MCLSLRLLPFIFCYSLAAFLPSCLPAQQPQDANSSPLVKAYVNEVIVPVVARNSHGQAVGDLTKDDFEVFDDGKPQTIAGFMVINRTTREAPVNSANPNPATNSATAAPQPDSIGPRFVVFLFDDMNLSAGDLMQAQQAATKAIDTSLSPSDVAAVLATSGANGGLTRDRAKLKQDIINLRVKNLYRHDAHDCPNVDYYMGDMIINKNDPRALEAATEEAMTCSQTNIREIATQMARQAAQRAVALGDQNFRTNLNFLRDLVSKMGPLPGQHVVILVSPGFLTPTAEAMTLKSEVLDAAARANVVINVLDARGLYTTGMDASQSGGGSPMSTVLQNQYRQASMQASSEVMEDLADGTGGTLFQNNNDLTVGFGNLITGPEFLYFLSFSSANMKPNGAYHKLRVKVRQSGLSIQARRGYFAPKPEKTKK
jgi:VWFA-related protein